MRGVNKPSTATNPLPPLIQEAHIPHNRLIQKNVLFISATYHILFIYAIEVIHRKETITCYNKPMSKILAIGAKMIVDPYKITETSSGVLRVDQGHSTPVKGTVISVGDESKFKEGDVVFFRRYSVDELKIPQEDGSEKSMFIVEDNDVVARLVE
jgi:co-chaperonin GroES (HSP10)